MKRRGSSKLLAEDPPENFDSFGGRPSKEFGGPSKDFGAPSKEFGGGSRDFGGAAQGSSPLPKMLGGVVVIMALVKMAVLIMVAPGYLATPGYVPVVVDMVASAGGLALCGVALLMSKN